MHKQEFTFHLHAIRAEQWEHCRLFWAYSTMNMRAHANSQSCWLLWTGPSGFLTACSVQHKKQATERTYSARNEKSNQHKYYCASAASRPPFSNVPQVGKLKAKKSFTVAIFLQLSQHDGYMTNAQQMFLLETTLLLLMKKNLFDDTTNEMLCEHKTCPQRSTAAKILTLWKHCFYICDVHNIFKHPTSNCQKETSARAKNKSRGSAGINLFIPTWILHLRLSRGRLIYGRYVYHLSAVHASSLQRPARTLYRPTKQHCQGESHLCRQGISCRHHDALSLS